MRVGHRKGGLFASPEAALDLLLCIAISMVNFVGHIRSRSKPEPIYKADLLAGLEAVRVLQSLESRGANFAGAVKMPSGRRWRPPFNWVRQLEGTLQTALAEYKKPARDSDITYRETTKTFARWLWIIFGESPPVVVQSFGRLIGYESEALGKRHLPAWVKSFRTDSLL